MAELSRNKRHVAHHKSKIDGTGRRPVAAGRASTRPLAQRAGGTRTGAATRTAAPRPRRRVTGRAIVLGVVLVALALSYVFPLRIYLAQQAEIAQLRADQREQQARIDRLAATAALWADEDYIRIQARKRLYLGEPGEMLLLVTAEEPAAPAPGTDPQRPPPGPPPWWETLWTSVESANADPPPAGEEVAGQEVAG